VGDDRRRFGRHCLGVPSPHPTLCLPGSPTCPEVTAAGDSSSGEKLGAMGDLR